MTIRPLYFNHGLTLTTYIYYTILHHFLIAFAVRRHVNYVLFFCIPSNTLFQFYAALSIDQVDAT